MSVPPAMGLGLGPVVDSGSFPFVTLCVLASLGVFARNGSSPFSFESGFRAKTPSLAKTQIGSSAKGWRAHNDQVLQAFVVTFSRSLMRICHFVRGASSSSNWLSTSLSVSPPICRAFK